MTGYLFRPPWSTPESRAGRPPRPRTEKLPGMLIERDVAVAVAPGEPIYIDVYRPDTQVPAAPLIAWSPYGKHNPAPIGILYPRSGVRPEHTSEITTFFTVCDADAKYRRIEALGVDWVLRPATQPWGSRSMVFKDPEGNLVNVFSRP